MLQIRAFAHGRVQGVNFRYNIYRKATELRLKGFVRNLVDGSVEIVAQGPSDNLEKLISYTKDSPGFSFVSHLDVEWEEPQGELEKFYVKF